MSWEKEVEISHCPCKVQGPSNCWGCTMSQEAEGNSTSSAAMKAVGAGEGAAGQNRRQKTPRRGGTAPPEPPSLQGQQP